jgi:hypothetical protein
MADTKKAPRSGGSLGPHYNSTSESISDLPPEVKAEVQRIVAKVRRTGEPWSERFAAYEIYAYAHPAGNGAVAWGLNRVSDGCCAARGIARPDDDKGEPDPGRLVLEQVAAIVADEDKPENSADLLHAIAEVRRTGRDYSAFDNTGHKVSAYEDYRGLIVWSVRSLATGEIVAQGEASKTEDGQ